MITLDLISTPSRPGIGSQGVQRASLNRPTFHASLSAIDLTSLTLITPSLVPMIVSPVLSAIPYQIPFAHPHPHRTPCRSRSAFAVAARRAGPSQDRGTRSGPDRALGPARCPREEAGTAGEPALSDLQPVPKA